MMFVAALMMAQAAATPPAQAPAIQPSQITVKQKKPKEHCQYMEVTGSHARQRVCQDDSGNLEMPGVSDAAVNAGMMHATPGAAKGGFGGTPQ